MKATYCIWRVILISLIVAETTARRSHKTRRKGTSVKTSSKTEEQSDDIPGWYNTDDILEAISPMDYRIPKGCSKAELEATMMRCVLIWKGYCECKHCMESCAKDDWPPEETKSWGKQRNNVGWRQVEDAWKWASKCAYNATNLWRIWCGDGNVFDEKTGDVTPYKYWFLVDLVGQSDLEEVKDLCSRKECPDRGDTSRTASPVLTVASKGGNSIDIGMKERQDVIDAVGPNLANEPFPATCSNDALGAILNRCTVIWQNYCRCAGCDMPCNEAQWPPEETNDWSAPGRKIGWEEMNEAWKWAAKCAYNATYLWRTFCYVRSPEGNSEEMMDQPEHEYWFLTELNQDAHPKVVQGLCETSECYKYTEIVKTESAVTTKATTTAKRTNRPSTTTASKSTSSSSNRPPDSKSAVPKWAYIIIAVLGAVVVLMLVFAVLFLHYRSQSKAAKKHPKSRNDHRQMSTVENSSSWQTPSSFAFFGERALPGIGEGIYHTITDTPPPSSPTFPMASFSNDEKTPAMGEAAAGAKSVNNVLYHDTTPRYPNTNGTRFSMFAASNDQPHTYEDTLPAAAVLPDTPPYFVPTGEYDTLGDSTPTTINKGPSGDEERKQNKGNYDHIQLL